MIDSFTGDYRWLSNFWPSPIRWNGHLYPTVEHAYQAAKTTDKWERAVIQKAKTPGAAKKLGRTLQHINPCWDLMKVNTMRSLLIRKFMIPELAEKLKATGDEELVEGNTWGDTFWGVCRGEGQNRLGRLLMEIRSTLG